MNDKNRHPSRKQMLDAIEAGRVPFKTHLAQCSDCQEFFELLSTYASGDDAPLIGSTSEAVARYSSISVGTNIRATAILLRGQLTTDSWSQVPSVQLRDIGVGMERRLKLEANGIVLEIAAERQRDGWEFVARIYEDNEVTSEFALKVGNKKYMAGSDGFYHWSSRRPPGTFRLLSDALKVEFEKVSWLTAVTN